MTEPRPKVAYLLKRFPRLSETFILHEVLELERQGVALRLYSIMNPGETIVHADVGRVRAPIRYFPLGPRARHEVFRAHLALLKRHLRRYLSTVGYILRHRPHRTAVKHFLRAGWLAHDLEVAGVSQLHAHFASGPASVARFASMLTGMPYSFTAHAKDIYTAPPALLAAKMDAASFVITCTEYNAQYLASLVTPSTARRIHRIYHGVDLCKFAPTNSDSRINGSSTHTPTILAVGRLVEKKGFPYLIEAMGQLRRRGYDARLQIVGDGEMREPLARQIAAAGLEELVSLLGPRPQEALLDLYRGATLFVLPCIVTDGGDRDGIPNVLVEAMRLGIPVVSTQVSGIPELIKDDQTGLLVPSRDAYALTDALARLLDHQCLRERLADAAAEHVLREFDLAGNAGRVRGLLEGVAA
jgi:glycosyltransferase involved in cell wall biosynthesis